MARTPRRTIRKPLRVHGQLAKKGRRRRVRKNLVAARKRTVPSSRPTGRKARRRGKRAPVTR